ncbi:MAG: peptidoglycan-N-acetylglucosamine deacetylase, partial [Acidimicrobiaceae bacterium]|nr:peptidoglycan-N-acetylglucosamine deacetylase [Acidimicrobiaceae bacterium]
TSHAAAADPAATAAAPVTPATRPADPTRPAAGLPALDLPDPTEDLVPRVVPVAAGGLPEVESLLWYPGIPGADEQMVGTVSGRIDATRRLFDPQPARREMAPVVALTFDDGPDPRWTPMILQLLAEKNVKATFCLVGYLARRHPELVLAERDQGHVLCDHTEHHVEHLDAAPHDQVVQEVTDGARSIASITGVVPPLYRAPGGHLGPDVVAVARGQGLRVLQWSVDPHDYERPPAAVIAARILSTFRPGAVILLHDGGGDRGETVAAVRIVIDTLKAQGWAFATPMFGPPPP